VQLVSPHFFFIFFFIFVFYCRISLVGRDSRKTNISTVTYFVIHNVKLDNRSPAEIFTPQSRDFLCFSVNFSLSCSEQSTSA